MSLRDLMKLPIIEVTGRNNLMGYLTERNYTYVKLEVETMTQEQAQRIWEQIKPNWNGVGLRSGKGRYKWHWLSLFRKMTLIKNKAEAEG